MQKIFYMGRIYNGMSAAKKLVMKELGYDKEKADSFVRIDLRNDLPALRTKEGAKFIFGAARMFCDRGLADANTIQQLNTTLKLVGSEAHINEYDRNLNGLSAQELIDRFKGVVSFNLEAEKEEISKMVFEGESDYDIVRIDSFEDAKKYGNYTSWCITQEESSFDGYTGNGVNQFYFCLHKGFDEVSKVAGTNAPLDDYGLSMIAVCVDENGMLTTCTCRWNHDNGGNDSIMNAKEVSMLINRNFYDVFKQNNLFQEKLDRALEGLRQGKPLWRCFDEVWKINNGFTEVRMGRKYNFLNSNNEFISKVWFAMTRPFFDGYAAVTREDKRQNFIDSQGNLLYKEWFRQVGNFSEGFASVECEDGLWNFIDKDGNYLYKNWYAYLGTIRNGFACVKIDDSQWNFIDKDENFLSDEWLNHVEDFDQEYARVVREDGLWNFIDKQGKFLFDKGFVSLFYFSEGYARVETEDGLFNFIDKEGHFLLKEGFPYICTNFFGGYAKVLTKDGLWNFIDTKGNFLFKESNFYVESFFYKENKYVPIKWEDGLWNFIDRDGHFLSKEGFLFARQFHNGFAAVQRVEDALWNFIDEDGNYLSKEWVLYASDFYSDFTKIERKNKGFCYIDKQGIFYDYKTKEVIHTCK